MSGEGASTNTPEFLGRGGVEKLPVAPRIEPVQFTCRMILDKERDISATTAYYPREGETSNVVLDGMVAAMERQKARYDISVEEDKIARCEAALRTTGRNMESGTKFADEEIEALQKQAVAANEAYKRQYTALQNAADNAERKFDPDKPGNKAKLDPLMAEYHRLDQEIKGKQVKRDSDARQIGQLIKDTNLEIAEARAKIDRLKVIVGT